MSVVSAAIVSGELILGLEDGSIIRAGYVQGPRGLSGEKGDLGSVGPAGKDGNGLLHGAGVPTFDDGKDNDFYIDTKAMKFYGPKAGGKWGSGVALLPKDRGGMLPTGMRTQGGAGARAFAAGISGPSSGGGAPPPTTGDGLDLITGHNKPLGAKTRTTIASDQKGDAMHVIIKADAAGAGSWYGEIVVTHFGTVADYTVAWEIPMGAAPVLSFYAIYNVNHIELAMESDVALSNIRGKIIYV